MMHEGFAQRRRPQQDGRQGLPELVHDRARLQASVVGSAKHAGGAQELVFFRDEALSPRPARLPRGGKALALRRRHSWRKQE